MKFVREFGEALIGGITLATLIGGIMTSHNEMAIARLAAQAVYQHSEKITPETIRSAQEAYTNSFNSANSYLGLGLIVSSGIAGTYFLRGLIKKKENPLS